VALVAIPYFYVASRTVWKSTEADLQVRLP
jgi:hypothetical protein